MGIKGIVTTTVLILALITVSITTAAAFDWNGSDICSNETVCWNYSGTFNNSSGVFCINISDWCDARNTSYVPIPEAATAATRAVISCDIHVNESGWWNDGGALNASTTPIQAAVDNATTGDVICVQAGNYNENVDIGTSHLTLQGAGADVVNVTAASNSDHVFNVSANYVNISGFNVTGATGSQKAGIYLVNVDHCEIFDNTASGNTASYNNNGIVLESSNYNTLTGNTASYNGDGIILESSNYNTLTGNTASYNGDGIILESSNYNTLTGNNAYYNGVGILLVVSSNNNTLTGNTAVGNDFGILLVESSNNNTLTDNNASGNVFGISMFLLSNNNTLTDNTAYDNEIVGISLGFLFEPGLGGSNNNTLTGNNASGNEFGILLIDSSNNNTLTGNNAIGNELGISLGFLFEPGLGGSSNNTLTGNNAVGNELGILLVDSSNNNTLTDNNASYNYFLGIGIAFLSNNNTLTGNTASYNSDGIAIIFSSNNTLTGNTAANNSDGIVLDSSNNNTLTGNTASYNDDGIVLVVSSNNNTLTGNTVSNNSNGIDLDASNSNLIYNNYFDNTNNACDDGINTWNITKTAETNIIGGPYLGGNYWSDYAGNDTDWDGLGDTLLPYNSSGCIQNGGDYRPLVIPDTTPPVIIITTPEPYGLYIVGVELNFSATDNESGVATIEGNLTNTSGVSQIVDSGDNITEPSVYTLVVTATDNAGNTNVSDPVFFVVYDPDGGHATGEGWFYPDDESTLPDGKANFGFTVKYKDSNSTGKLNFQYKDADLHLKSTSIDWLTISSVSAQFQGTGTINGEGLYTFRVQAKDNGEPGVDVDHFDIKIWSGTDTEADPYHKAKNTISGGNIQVQTG